MAELLWTDFVICFGLCDSGSALPMESVLVNRRAGEPSLLGSRWPLNIVLPDAVVVCPHYFCPAARIVLHILGKRDGVKLSSVFIAPLHY